MQYEISAVAKVLKVHERTVVRILSGANDAPFNKGTAATTTIPKLAKAFNASVKIWAAVLSGTDELITQPEASKILKIPERTMRHRRSREDDPDYRFAPDIDGGQTVRFSKKRIVALRDELRDE